MGDSGPETNRPPSGGIRRDLTNWVVRVALGVVGTGLVGSGSVSLFTEDNGTGTAAVVAAGVVVLVVAYLGPYVTKLKFQEFEAELDSARRRAVAEVQVARVEAVGEVVAKSDEVLKTLATDYERIRSTLPRGGTRDAQLGELMRQVEIAAARGEISLTQVREWMGSGEKGDRNNALGVMRIAPELRDFDLVLEAIENPYEGYDHDRFLLLASDMIPELSEEQRSRLKAVVEKQKETGKISPKRLRWHTAERLLGLLERRSK